MNLHSNANGHGDYHDTNWDCRECPECQAYNWVEGVDPHDINSRGTEVIKCWKCKNLYWSNDWVEDHVGEIEKGVLGCGLPDPMIPAKILHLIVDAAKDKYDDLTYEFKQGDPEMAEILNDLADAIDYVKEMLQDGFITRVDTSQASCEDAPF